MKQYSDESFVYRWSKKIKAFNLLGGKCKKCGSNDFRIIEFHHRDDKIKKVSDFIDNSWNDFWKEAKKCTLLCRNCHIETHSIKDSRWQKRKTKIAKIDSVKMLCKKCGISNVLCLDFHHRSPKEKAFNISTAIRSGFSVVKIMEEINKCDILCGNCHRLENIDIERLDRLREQIDEKVSRIGEAIKKETVNQNRVLELIHRGFRNYEIAKMLNCSPASVTNMIQYKNKISPKNKKEARVLELSRNNGLSSRKISNIMNVSRSYVRHVLKTRM